MLDTPFPLFISKKPGEIPIFGTFKQKNKKTKKTQKKSILAYISPEIDIFMSAMLYYIIVTSYVGRFSCFWYQWNEGTLSYTMESKNYTFGVSISNSQGVVITPLGRRVTKKAQEDEG